MPVKRVKARLAANAALAGEVPPARMYYSWLTQGASLPAISMIPVGDTPLNTTRGEIGTKNVRIQIDVWARTYQKAEALRDLVIAAMATEGTDFSAVRNGARPLYEDATDLHRYTLDYSLWYEA